MNDDNPDMNAVPLSVWVLTDGKIGDDVQCLAVAEALDASFEKRVVSPGFPWSAFAPWGPLDPREAPGRAGGPLHGEPPAIAIVSGRRAIPHARALKNASGGKTKIIILKDPRAAKDVADFLWAPSHDRLNGPNVFSTLTSPHGLSEKLKAAAQTPGAAIADLPKPFLGVVLGGATGGLAAGPDYSAEAAKDLASRVSNAARDFAAVAVTPSRRTPETFLEAFASALAHDHVFVWSGDGDNPYLDILATARALIVAGDSHNMVSEALAASASVYVWKPDRLAPKMEWFLSELFMGGEAREFVDAAPDYSRTPIDATPEIVAEIRRRLLL